MKKMNSTIKQFKSAIPSINKKYRPYADQVIKLFEERKIEKAKEAEKLLMQLSSPGLGPKSAIKKITEKYAHQKSITGRLTPAPIETFFVSGVIKSSQTYKRQLKKSG